MNLKFLWVNLSRIVLLLVVFMASQFLSALIMLFFSNLSNLFQHHTLDARALADSPTLMSFTIILSALVTLAVMKLSGWINGESFHIKRLKPAAFCLALLWMLPIIFVVNLLLESFALEDVNQELFARLIFNPWGVFALVFVGPFSEEVVFRMGIQHHLIRHRIHPWAAILLTAIIFGTIHGNPAQIPGAVVFGVVLGWLYWRSGSIWLSIAAHVFNNLLSILIAWATSDVETTIVELCGGTGTAVEAAFLSLILISFGFYYLNKTLNKA